MAKRNHVALLVAVGLGLAWLSANAAGPQAPASVRLYVFDGGTLGADPARFNLKPDEVAAIDFSVASYLVVHPKGRCCGTPAPYPTLRSPRQVCRRNTI